MTDPNLPTASEIQEARQHLEHLRREDNLKEPVLSARVFIESENRHALVEDDDAGWFPNTWRAAVFARRGGR